MGMFDDITVPKSYLRDLLTKNQEKLIKDNNYQTKSLVNALGQYKIYKQKLLLNDKSLWNCEPPDTEQRSKTTSQKYPYEKGRWSKVSHNGAVNFYTSFQDKDDNVWWSEFNFFFVDGVLDKKELVKFEIEETAEEAKKREEIWKERHAETDAFQRTFRYRFFTKVRAVLCRVLDWVQKQTVTPSPSSIKTDRQRAAKKAKTKPSFWKDY
tara:strand:- start:921 stop:1550 length:630 start_codon:yes stop_codon:yes gene_type:complete